MVEALLFRTIVMWDNAEALQKQKRRLPWGGQRDIAKNYSEVRQYSFGPAATAWREKLTLVSW